MDEFIDTITRTSIFAGLAREDLARVAGKLDEIRVAAGTVIIRQADPGDALYVVVPDRLLRHRQAGIPPRAGRA